MKRDDYQIAHLRRFLKTFNAWSIEIHIPFGDQTTAEAYAKLYRATGFETSAKRGDTIIINTQIHPKPKAE